MWAGPEKHVDSESLKGYSQTESRQTQGVWG